MSPVSDQQAADWLQSNPGFRQASSDPYQATAQTVRYMCSLINRSTDPDIITRAWQDAAQRFGGITGGSKARCAWWYAKTLLTFVHHQQLLQAWLGKADELQLLIEPAAVLKMADPKGDCAVYTTLICALLTVAGVGWEIVTVAVDPHQPDIFSHVYPRAILADGQRLPLDASHGKFAGWEVPAERVTRKQIWDQAGNAIEDQDSGYRGLHGVNMRGLGCPCRAGLGDDVVVDTSGIYTDVTGGNYDFTGAGSGWSDTSGSGSGSGWTSSSGSGSSSSAANTLSNLASQWTTIAGKILAPTTTYTSSTGATLTTPASSTSDAASLVSGASSLLSSATGSSSSLLLYLGIGAVALLLLAKGK